MCCKCHAVRQQFNCMCETCRRSYGDWRDGQFSYMLTAILQPLMRAPKREDFLEREDEMLLQLPPEGWDLSLGE
jgi:hypothetical protein